MKNIGFRDQLCSVDITEKMGICACWEKSNLKFPAISHVKVFIFKLRGGDMERLSLSLHSVPKNEPSGFRRL